jgi:hypothetical protein
MLGLVSKIKHVLCDKFDILLSVDDIIIKMRAMEVQAQFYESEAPTCDTYFLTC